MVVQYKQYGSDEEKAKRYNHRLGTSQKAFEKWERAGDRWYNRYEAVALSSQRTKQGRQLNVTTGVSVIDALFSGLTAIDVEFLLSPEGDTTTEQAILAETALNEEWTRLDVDSERDAAIKDSLVVGIGFVKVGYDYFATTVERDRALEDIEADVIRLIAEARAAGENVPTPDQIGKLVPSTEEVDEVLRDRIIVDYVPWKDIRWDPTAQRWKDVRWVAQLTKMRVEDIKANPLWREYVKRSRGGLEKFNRLKADSTIDHELILGTKADADDEFSTVVEYHDLETGTVCTFIQGESWFLNETVNPYALYPDFSDRSAFVPLVLRTTNRRVRGISDMEVMEKSLKEKDLYRTRTAEFTDRFVPKVIGPEDGLTDEGKENLANQEYGAYVSTAREIDPKSVTPMSPPVLPAEVFNMNDRIDEEIREATGVNELMRGLFPEQHRASATEAQAVVSQSAARQSEKRNTLERFHIEIAKRILHLMQQFYDQPRMAAFADPSLGNVPWEFTGSDLVGEFTMKVSLAPREAETRQSRREEALAGLNVLGPFAEPDQTGAAIIEKATLASWFMRKFGFARQDIVELLQQKDEQQVQRQELLQAQAASAAAASGQVAPGLNPGPLTEDEVVAASNASPPPAGVFGPGQPPVAGAQ